MKIHFVNVVAGTVIGGLFGAYGCAPSSQSEARRSLGTPSAQSSVPQSQSGALKSPTLTDDTLRQGRDNSSLDALLRGDSPTTPRDSALKEIYFAFDQYDLDGEDRATLRATADWLKKNPAARVEVEGHSDERGTNEYNLALGAKRAQAAKDYLVSLGVAANRIPTVSYGEEIPTCRSQGEDCWQKNRRDRFVMTAKGLAF